MPQPPRKRLVFLVFCARLLIALLTVGFFQPDEYFQALEPAHRVVFGFGHLTWEWVANPPIRSFVYPSLFVPAYYLVKKLGLENTVLLFWAPKLVQVIFATFGDIALYSLASLLLTEDHAALSLFLSLISPFNALALTRTLSNSTETSLTTMALVFWPFPGSRSRPRTRIALSLAALSCIIRPTGLVLWIFLGFELVWRWRLSASRIMNLICDTGFVGILALAITVVIDSAYYGALTLTPVSFVQTNILSGIAQFYGVNSFHYYLTQGLPIILGSALPFALHGIWLQVNLASTRSVSSYSPRTHNSAGSILLGLILWTVFVYSWLAHKEWRFIHPLLPILHIFAADSLIKLGASAADWTYNAPSSTPDRSKRLPIRRSHLALLLGVSIPLNIYLIRVHGSAQVIAARYLHSLGQDQSRIKSIGVLMPCHSIPWQSHIHLPHLEREDTGSRLWALGCEPPLGLDSVHSQSYTSQTDVFFETLGPTAYFQTYFPQNVNLAFPPSPAPYTIPGNSAPEHGWRHTWPSHLLMFGALEHQPASLSNSTQLAVTVKTRLEELGYKVVRHIGNGWEEDARRKGGIIIWEWAGRVL